MRFIEGKVGLKDIHCIAPRYLFLNYRISFPYLYQGNQKLKYALISVLHAKSDKKTNYVEENENVFEVLFAELLRSLDSNINISNFYKSELFNYLHVGLVKRTHG